MLDLIVYTTDSATGGRRVKEDPRIVAARAEESRKRAETMARIHAASQRKDDTAMIMALLTPTYT
jgi:hypothetical protein